LVKNKENEKAYLLSYTNYPAGQNRFVTNRLFSKFAKLPDGRKMLSQFRYNFLMVGCYKTTPNAQILSIFSF